MNLFVCWVFLSVFSVDIFVLVHYLWIFGKQMDRACDF